MSRLRTERRQTYVRKGIAAADLAEVLHRAMRARPLTLLLAAA